MVLPGFALPCSTCSSTALKMQRTRLEAVRIGQANPSNKSLDYSLNETLKTGTPQPHNPTLQAMDPQPCGQFSKWASLLGFSFKYGGRIAVAAFARDPIRDFNSES